MHKSGAVFDVEKLKWFNHEHLKKLSDAEYAERLEIFCGKKFDARLAPLLKERARTLVEAAQLLQEYDFLTGASITEEMLLRGVKTGAEAVIKHLEFMSQKLQELPEHDFTQENIKNVLFTYATQQGRASVLWPLRVALSGKEKSPDPFAIAALLGKKESLRRIAEARNCL